MQTIRFALSKTSSMSSARLSVTKSTATVKFMIPRRTNGSLSLICACPVLELLYVCSRTITSSLSAVVLTRRGSSTPSKCMTSLATFGRRSALQRLTSRAGSPATWALLTRLRTMRFFCSEARVLQLSTSSMVVSFLMLRRWRLGNVEA